MSERPKLKKFQIITHTVFIILGWISYFYLWKLVLKTAPERVEMGIILVLVSFVVGLIATLYWVYHNIWLFRRKGPRQEVQHIEYNYTHDWNEHEIHATWDKVKTLPMIHVHIDHEKKEKHFIERNLYD